MTFTLSRRTGPIVAGMILLVPAIWMVGCGSKPSGDAALVATGKTVFDSNGCARCHSIGGQGGRMAPDLSHVGADPQHTPQWLAQHVRNPRSQDPASKMPAFGGKISDSDLQALGTYLASLK